MQPEELLYAPTHEWVHVDRSGGEKIATIGISHFAVECLRIWCTSSCPKPGHVEGRRDVWRGRIGQGGERFV